MKIYFPDHVIFRNKTSGERIPLVELEETINSILHNCFSQYIRDAKYCTIQDQLSLTGNHLIPSFNGCGKPELSSIFTSLVFEKFYVDFPVINKAANAVAKALKKAVTRKEVMDIILVNTELQIGSIGSRSTNHDSSYEIIFRNVPTSILREKLSEVVELVNEDQRNKEWTTGFILTCLQEVAQFMDSIGKKDFLIQAIERMKVFEAQNHLRAMYESDGKRIQGYQDKTTIHKYNLAKI